jgi:hypothetical protein
MPASSPASSPGNAWKAGCTAFHLARFRLPDIRSHVSVALHTTLR